MKLVGIDTGGTFTDFLFQTPLGFQVHKVLSTPKDPAQAVFQGLREKGKNTQGLRIIHGSTVATNVLLERKGAKTALLTNKGFTDVLEIGRQIREDLYTLSYKRQPPLIPRELRFGVEGRVLWDGTEQKPLQEEEIEAIALKLKELAVESVAVVFLHSYVHAGPEERAARIMRKHGFFVSASHAIVNEFREYERTSTTAVNAYVMPKMEGYLQRLEEGLGDENLSIMQSNGGRIRSSLARQEPVRTVVSGPAGGVVGALELGRMAGYHRLMTLDMGGTSTDVALLDGGIPMALESNLAGQPIHVPMVDIHTVGAGGGSLAFLDGGGALKVGPESAGADPGPICYGKGEVPTVTDANLYLGRLASQYFLGGTMKLTPERLPPYMEALASRAGLSSLELAEGICSVVNANMERALRVISVERGHDPRDFSLFSYGGAGGMHAVFLARLLGMPRVIVPPNPGLLSAVGMILSDVLRDASRTVLLPQEEAPKVLPGFFQELEEEIMGAMAQEGFYGEEVVLESYLDMRYRGQSHELMIPYTEDVVEQFHARHGAMYGYHRLDQPVEVVTIRLRGRGRMEKPVWPRQKEPASLKDEAIMGYGDVQFQGSAYSAPLYHRDFLQYGNEIPGPALILEYSSTTVLPKGSLARIDAFGNLIVEVMAG